MAITKQCTKCKEWRDIDCYTTATETASGFRYWCNVCAAKASKQWKERNPERTKTIVNDWYQNNKQHKAEQDKAYRLSHKAERRQLCLNYRAQRRNARGSDYTTPEHIAARWAMYGNKCWMCGTEAEATDHVKPLFVGGSNFPSNLRPICKSCNSIKGPRWNGVSGLSKLKS